MFPNLGPPTIFIFHLHGLQGLQGLLPTSFIKECFQWLLSRVNKQLTEILQIGHRLLLFSVTILNYSNSWDKGFSFSSVRYSALSRALQCATVRILHTLSALFITTALCSRYYNYPHFVGENVLQQLTQGHQDENWQSWDLNACVWLLRPHGP